MATPSIIKRKRFRVGFSFLILSFLFLSGVGFSETVKFSTREKVTLVGDFESPLEGKGTVVMLHGLGSGQGEWEPMKNFLKSMGWGFLAYDARGHGASSTVDGGKADAYKKFGNPGSGSGWDMMVSDLGAAVRYLNKEKKIKRDQIFIMGASLGANVAFNFGVLGRSVPGVVLLSPGLKYAGIETQSLAEKAKIPVLLIAGESDTYAYSSAIRLKTLNETFDLWTDVKPGHGVQMFDGNLEKRIFEWLGNHLSKK